MAASLLAGACVSHGQGPQADSQRYMQAVRAFADTVLEHGRDTYGPRQTPLFVDGLQVETLEPVRWKKGGQTWVLCNFASQQSLLRTLDGLSALTGDDRYRQAAEDATRYALAHLRSTNGLIYWGGHMAWDLDQDRAVGEYPDIHEMKNHQAYYPLLWRVDPAATRQVFEAIWGGHVLDWSLLDYNRHAKTEKPAPALWDHPFVENTPVPFASVANNLSFTLVTPSLVDAGVTLATARQEHQCADLDPPPDLPLAAGARSQDRPVRRPAQLPQGRPRQGHAGPRVSGHQRSQDRRHLSPDDALPPPAAGADAGGRAAHCGRRRYADVGREFIRWASEDLKAYGQLLLAAEDAAVHLAADGRQAHPVGEGAPGLL